MIYSVLQIISILLDGTESAKFSKMLRTLCLKDTIIISQLILSSLGNVFAEDVLESCRIIRTEKSYFRTADNRDDVRLWPSPRIPYQLHSSMRDQDIVAFKQAVNDYEMHTCLRFPPRLESDAGYLLIKMLSRDDICGQAEFCYQGTATEVEVSYSCSSPRTFIHEIGHGLCLEHEQIRVDRDDYLDYSQCNNPGNIESITDSLTTRGNMYDYTSSMHYYCSKCTGLPKMTGVPGCGRSVNDIGLSVLDADKLNVYYDCRGCHRHRWYRVDSLTSQQKKSLVNFAPHSAGASQPIYMCRGYYAGEISPGIYIESERVCEIPVDNHPRKVTKDIQIFGLPNGPNSISNTSSDGYRLLYPWHENTGVSFVPAGRMRENDKLYAAVRRVRENDGRISTLIGKVHYSYLKRARFIHEGRQKAIDEREGDDDEPQYYIIGCSE